MVAPQDTNTNNVNEDAEQMKSSSAADMDSKSLNLINQHSKLCCTFSI